MRPGRGWSRRRKHAQRDVIVRKRIRQMMERVALARRLSLGERRQFPQAFPARTDALLKQEPAFVHDPRAILRQRDSRLAFPLDRQSLGIVRSRRAKRQHRAQQALRLARPAERRAEFHDGRVIGADVFGREQFRRRGPERRLAGSRVDGNTQMRDPRQHAGDIRVDDRRRPIIRKRNDRARRVAAHAGQRGNVLQGFRKDPAALVADDPGCPVQVARPGVVAEAFPGSQDVFLGSIRQRAHVGETFEPAAVVIQHSGNLRLLEHEFTHQHGVRIAGAPPGQVAAVLGEPFDQCGLECAPIFWFLETGAVARFSFSSC